MDGIILQNIYSFVIEIKSYPVVIDKVQLRVLDFRLDCRIESPTHSFMRNKINYAL